LSTAAIGLNIDLGVVADELPVTLPDGHLLAKAPMEKIMGGIFVFAGKEGEEVNAFKFPFGLGSHGGGGESRGVQVCLYDHRVEDARLDVGVPRHDKRHADTTLQGGALGKFFFPLKR
jgi:hypothetical protein